MLYTSEGAQVKRYNVCNRMQLPDFADGLHGAAYALRILADNGHKNMSLGHMSWRDPEGRGGAVRTWKISLWEVPRT